MSSNGNAKRMGMSFLEVLQLIFIVLKLCKVIKWSWIWVLSPSWIPLIIVVIALIIYKVIYAISKKKEMKNDSNNNW